MPAICEFTVPGDPVALKRHRTFRRGKFSGTYDPSKGDKADFLAKALEHRPDVPLDQPLAVTLLFYFGRPKSHYRTGKNKHLLRDDAPTWHTRTPDADNLAKLCADALNGIFWRDDSCISALTVMKRYDNVPRTVVSVWDMGVDDDATNL